MPPPKLTPNQNVRKANPRKLKAKTLLSKSPRNSTPGLNMSIAYAWAYVLCYHPDDAIAFMRYVFERFTRKF